MNPSRLIVVNPELRRSPLLRLSTNSHLGCSWNTRQYLTRKAFWNVVLQKAIKNSVDGVDTTQDEWMDSVQIKSWQRTSGPCEITETWILWTYDTEIWKSGEGNGWLQKSWTQRRRWTDDTAESTGMKINEAAAAAEDRDRWRGILRAANPSDGGRHWTTTTTTFTRWKHIAAGFEIRVFCHSTVTSVRLGYRDK